MGQDGQEEDSGAGTMIVPMKKVYILLSKSWVEGAIAKLGEVGLLHVSHVNRPAGTVLSELEEKKVTLGRVLSLLKGQSYVAKASPLFPNSIDEAVRLCEGYMELTEEHEVLREEMTGLKDEYRRASIWGDFDKREIASLEESGLQLKLFTCSDDRLDEIPEGVAFSIIGCKGETCFVAAMTREEAPNIPFPLIGLPERPAGQVKSEMDEMSARISAIEKEQSEISRRKADIAAALKKLENTIAFESVGAGMGEDEGVAYIAGFVPVRDIAKIERLAAENRWGFMTADPDAEDDVPTLLEHSRLTALFQPIMNFIGVKPGYFEFDTNGIFLLFFSLFFAMIVGDAGYGLLILAGALVAGKFFPELPKEGGRLFVVLSITTIIWGSVTGNWFGIDAAGVPLIGSLILPGLSSVNPASGAVVMEICFFLALMHLSVAHLWKGLLFMPSIRALSEAGWVMLLIGIYMIVRFLVLKTTFPESATLLIALGFAMVLLFSGQQGDGFVRGLKRGLSQFPLFLLDGIGGLSNIVSYLRLFAVGIASKEVAIAFNGIAVGLGFDSITSIILAVFVLIFGHTVNMILIAMSVIVHGIRLNILEFSGQMKMEWSGIPYEPFGGKEKE